MNGPFGNRFPYTNFHEMNLDWVIQIAKDFLDHYTHIQDLIEQGEADIDEKASDALEALAAKETELEGLLDAWYTEHSGDIADALADALADLNEWYTTHEHYLDDELAANIEAFNSAAAAKAAETLADIPEDYTTLDNAVKNSESIVVADWEQGTITNDGSESSSTTRIRTDYIPVKDNMYISVESGYNMEADFYDLTHSTYLGNSGWLSGFTYIFKDDATHVRFLMKKTAGTSIEPDDNIHGFIGINDSWNAINSMKANYSFHHIADTDNGQLLPDTDPVIMNIYRIKPNHLYDVFVSGGNRRVFGLSNCIFFDMFTILCDCCSTYYLNFASG